jgi:hypothetical protein
MNQTVARLLRRSKALWEECDTCPSAFEFTYSPREQSAREARLDRFLDAVNSELHHPPRTPSEREATQERITAAFSTLARSALDFEERHLEVLFQRGFSRVGVELAQAARRFDPAISAADIFQASRNAWVMNGLQLLLGLPAELTPAVFAYSLLYPYSDNFLDDSKTTSQAKRTFNTRFRRRLEGDRIRPLNTHEQAVCELVAMIEGQFARPRYPQVFESLLAIHRAQEKSLHLAHRNGSPHDLDVLGITFEKGGASVLADGYLAAGTLTQAQVEFIFGWGVFLQLGDDLQDLHEDLRHRRLTLFSKAAGRQPLDALTNRVFRFGARALKPLDDLAAPDSEPVKELMRRSGAMLLVTAAGSAGRFYTAPYLRELETHSPFRFSFLNQRRKRFSRKQGLLTRLIEAFASAGETRAAHLSNTLV